MKVSLPFPPKELSPNGRHDRRAISGIRARYRDECFYLCLDRRPCLGGLLGEVSPCPSPSSSPTTAAGTLMEAFGAEQGVQFRAPQSWEGMA